MLRTLFVSLALGSLSAGLARQVSPPADVAWYCQQLVKTVDLWNGGLDGTSGMGVYLLNFEGAYHVNLTREWDQTGRGRTTSIAQARGIYMNIEAYRATGAERFLKAAEQGTQFLLDTFWDEAYGGFYFEAERSGMVVGRNKQGYGNVFALFTLAHMYDITRKPEHLQAALKQLDVLEKHFIDPKQPGVVLPGFNFDFSALDGYHNVDTFTHYFEGLMALHDVTDGETRARVDKLITDAGQALTTVLYKDEEGFKDRGYVAYNYTSNWEPRQEPYTRNTQWTVARQATTGHNIELAYLISRAVERGFPAVWLTTADKLKKFVEVHAMHPETGGMLYEVTDYDGKPLQGNPDNDYYVWWANSEAARAFLHFAVVRKENTLDAFKKQENFIKNHFLDPEYGGWYQMVHAETLRTFDLTKGNVWTVNYHETMLAAEVLRLGKVYAEQMGNPKTTCPEVTAPIPLGN